MTSIQKCDPTICCDIHDFRWESIGPVDVIWSSPPCQRYSIDRTLSKDKDLESSDNIVRKTLEIIEALGNVPHLIENPATGKLKSRGLLDHLNMSVVDYCTFSFPYRKRTAIWSNTYWKPSQPLCNKTCPFSDGKRHFNSAQKGPPGVSFSTWELYRIPPDLCAEIAQFCDNL